MAGHCFCGWVSVARVVYNFDSLRFNTTDSFVGDLVGSLWWLVWILRSLQLRAFAFCRPGVSGIGVSLSLVVLILSFFGDCIFVSLRAYSY